MSREGALVKNTLILSLGTFLPKLASFITLPILTAFLTKEEYGTYDLITVLVSLFLPAVTLQVQTAAFRFLIDERDNGEETGKIISTIFCFILPLSFIALVVLWFFLPAELTAVRFFICAYFAVDIVVNATRQIARGLNKTLDYSISAIISAFGKMLFAVVFVWQYQLGLLGACISLFGATFISFVVLANRIHLAEYLKIKFFSTELLKKLLAYSWPMVPNSMSMWVMRLSDRLVVTSFMGLAWNAVYAVSNKIPSLLNLAQSSFVMAWQENASIVSKDEDAEQYYSAMFSTIYDFMSGVLGILICTTPILFSVLVQGDYEDAYQQMPILFLAQLFYAMATFLGGIYVAFKRTKSVGITTIVAASCNLIIDIVLIKSIGLYAASGSTFISYLFLLLYRMYDIRRIVGLKYEYIHIVAVFCILVLESVFCYINTTILNLINILLGVSLFIVLNKKLIKRAWIILKRKVL